MQRQAKCSIVTIVIGAALGWAVSMFGGCSSKQPKEEVAVECPQVTSTTVTTTTQTTLPRRKPDATVDQNPTVPYNGIKLRIQPHEEVLCYKFGPLQRQLLSCDSEMWRAECMD